MKKIEKNKAIKLRKSGHSYKEIADILQLSKSTLSLWFKDCDWSLSLREALTKKAREDSKLRLTLLNKKRLLKLSLRYQQVEKEAVAEFNNLKNNKLFITVISLYWGEGDRVFKNGIVRISNVDPVMLKVFIIFLREICYVDISKIRAGVLIYPDLDYNKCLKFWSHQISIFEDRFFQPTLIKGKTDKKKTGHGVCIVSVHDKYLKKKVLTWLELFKKETPSAGIV